MARYLEGAIDLDVYENRSIKPISSGSTPSKPRILEGAIDLPDTGFDWGGLGNNIAVGLNAIDNLGSDKPKYNPWDTKDITSALSIAGDIGDTLKAIPGAFKTGMGTYIRNPKQAVKDVARTTRGALWMAPGLIPIGEPKDQADVAMERLGQGLTADAPIVASTIANPLRTAIGVGSFMGLNELQNVLVSKVKNKDYKPLSYSKISELLPDETPEFVKGVADATNFVAQVALLHKAGKVAPEIGTKLTKDFTATYNPPKTISISGADIKDIFQTGTKLSTEANQFIRDLRLDAKGYRDLFTTGVKIDIPIEKITTMTDKPYWGKVKKLFGQEPVNVVTKTSMGKATKAPLGLLPESTEQVKNVTFPTQSIPAQLVKAPTAVAPAAQPAAAPTGIVPITPKAAPIEAIKPVYRGVSPAEWESIQKTGKVEGLNLDNTLGSYSSFTENKNVADAHRSLTDGYMVEFKPEAVNKLQPDIGGQKGNFVGRLTKDDIVKVTDKDGNVIFDVNKSTAPQGVRGVEFPRAAIDDTLAKPNQYDKGKSGLSDTLESPSKDYDLLQNEKKKSIVYRDENGNPQGVIAFNVKPDGTLETRLDYGGNVEINVNPEFRRKGIATKLYEKAKEMGYDLDKIEGTAYTPDGEALARKRLSTPPITADNAPLLRGTMPQQDMFGTKAEKSEPILTPQEQTEINTELKRKSQGGFIRLSSGIKEKLNLTDNIDITMDDLKDSAGILNLSKQYLGDKLQDLKHAIMSAELPQNLLYSYSDSRPVAEGVIDGFAQMLKEEIQAKTFFDIAKMSKHPKVLADIAGKADRNPSVNPFVLLAKAKKDGLIDELDEVAFKKGLYFLVKNKRDMLAEEILASRIGVRAKSNGTRFNVTYKTKNGKISERKNISSGMLDSIKKKFTVSNVEELGEEVIFKHADPKTGEYTTKKVMVKDYAKEIPAMLKAEEKALVDQLLPYGPANYIPHNRRGGDAWVEAFELDPKQGRTKVFSARVPNMRYAGELVKKAKELLPGADFEIKPHDYRMKQVPSLGSMADVQVFLEQVGVDMHSTAGQKIINAYRAMSPLMSSLISSQNIAGWKSDWNSIIDEAYTGLMSGIKRRYRMNIRDLNSELKNIKDDFRHNVAFQYIKDLTASSEQPTMLTNIADGTKAITYTMYLANSLTYTAQNLTEGIWSIAPAIEQMKNPLGLLIPLSKEYTALTDKAVKEGILQPFFEVTAIGKNIFQRLDILGRLSESWSSARVFETGLKVARDKKLTGEEAYNYAVQFLFNKGKPFYENANSPIFMQGDKWGVVRKYGFILLRWILNFWDRFARGSLKEKAITLMGIIALTGLQGIPGGRTLLDKTGAVNLKKNFRKYGLLEKFLLAGIPGMLGVDTAFLRPSLLIKGIGDMPSAFRQLTLLGGKMTQMQSNYNKYGLQGGIGSIPGLRPILGDIQARKGIIENRGKRKKVIYRPKGMEKDILRTGFTPFGLGEFNTRKYSK